MHHEIMRETKDLIFEEMRKINSKGEINNTDLSNLCQASKVLLNLGTFEAMEEYGEDASFSMGRRAMPHGTSVRRGMSGHYPGEFYREMYRDDGRQIRTYEDGYSGHSIEDVTIMNLEHQMDNAKSDYDRKFLQDQIRAIREKQMK